MGEVERQTTYVPLICTAWREMRRGEQGRRREGGEGKGSEGRGSRKKDRRKRERERRKKRRIYGKKGGMEWGSEGKKEGNPERGRMAEK